MESSSTKPDNKEGEGYRLYVSNIDPTLKESDVKDLFANFGKPIHVYRHHNDSGPGWAFVSYFTKKEADLAILKLHEASPHNLKVKYARSSKEKEQMREEKVKGKQTRILQPNSSVVLGHLYPTPANLGRGRGFFISPEVRLPGNKPKILDGYGIGLHGLRSPDEFSNASYRADEYDHTNSFMMRGVNIHSSSFDTPSKVKIDYNLKNYSYKDKRKICEIIEEICAKINSDIVSGNCLVCETLTTQCCQRCGTWYCSQTCQRSDWHRHRSSCGATNDKSRVTNSFLRETNEEKNQRHVKNDQGHAEQKKKNIHKTYAKGKANLKTSTDESNADGDTNKNNGSHCDDRSYVPRGSNDVKHCKTSVNERLKIRHTISGNNDIPNTIKTEQETQGSSVKDVDSSKTSFSGHVNEEESSFPQQGIFKKGIKASKLEMVKLSKDVFEKVKVTVPTGAFQCWVQREDSKGKLVEVMAALNDGSEGSPVKDLKQGIPCVALYEDLWYRGRVTCIEPELKVFYIDYGNEESCTLNQLRSVPAALKDTPALAVKIKLAEGTSKKYEVLTEDQVLSVKCVDESDDAVIVHVEGEDYPEKRKLTPTRPKLLKVPSRKTSEMSTPLQRSEERPGVSQPEKLIHNNCAVLGLKVGMKGACQFQQWLPDRNFGVTIIYPEVKEKFNKLYETLLTEFKKTPLSEEYKPQIGETVAAFVQVESAQNSEIWNRAHVLDIGKGNYQINFCDMAQLATVKSVYKLPQDLASVPEFGARCSIIGRVKPRIEEFFKEQRGFKFTVKKVNEFQKTATCIMHMDNDDEVGTVVLRQWTPLAKERICKETSLKDNDRVVMPVYFDLNTLYFRPLRDEFSKIDQTINCYCISTKCVDEIPAKNEIVGCRFQADGKYYRAKILEVNKDKIKVFYIDYGNIDYVDRNKLKLLSPDLKKIPAVAMKVGWKDIAQKTLTRSAVDFLTKVVREEIEMKVVIPGLMKDDVRFILPDGRNLYDEIKKCLEEEQEPVEKSTKNKLKENKILTEKDIKYLEFPIGKTIELLVLHKVDSTLYMCSEGKGEVMLQVHGVMSEEMNKFCESTDDKFYEPEMTELCFAKFKGGLWHRGICVSDKRESEYEILFVDFGNVSNVDKKNIRKMTEDFIKIPAVATLCSLNGIMFEKLTEEQKQQLDELVELNKTYDAKIISCDGPGNYTIEFSHVTKSLKYA